MLLRFHLIMERLQYHQLIKVKLLSSILQKIMDLQEMMPYKHIINISKEF